MSYIKLCLIPPRGLEQHMLNGDMIMSLAQLVAEPGEYSSTLLKMNKSKFVIMDNGANEGEELSYLDLEYRANYLNIDELVLPDVLGNSTATLAASADFLRQRTVPLKHYMGVVQGEDLPQLHHLVDAYSKMRGITTLGLPRLLLKQIGVSCRIDLANWIDANYSGRFALHLLGASSLWAKEVYYALKYAPFIRSIDTSLPYNYGLKGERIDRSKRKIDRPIDYLTADHSKNQLTTVLFNEDIYRSWCRGIL